MLLEPTTARHSLSTYFAFTQMVCSRTPVLYQPFIPRLPLPFRFQLSTVTHGHTTNLEMYTDEFCLTHVLVIFDFDFAGSSSASFLIYGLACIIPLSSNQMGAFLNLPYVIS